MTKLKIMSVSEASLFARSGQLNASDADKIFLLVGQMLVTFIDHDDQSFAAQSVGGDESGFFDCDLGLLETLSHVRQSKKVIGGLFALVSDDVYSITTGESFRARCVAVTMNGQCFFPESSAVFDRSPLDDLRMMGLAITRRCPSAPAETAKKSASVDGGDVAEFERLLSFFKTPTSEWGSAQNFDNACDCGAKYTSFTDVHLSYCCRFFRNSSRR